MAPRKASSAQGATRKTKAQKAPRQWSFGWLNRLLILAGTGVVAVAGIKAYLTVVEIPVQHITVTGELANTQAATVQSMVQDALMQEGGFLKVDLNGMRVQLEALPWIYEASVRRRWPNALNIHVVEQLPIARWGEDGFINHEGGIFRSERSADWDKLPRLSGPEGSAASLVVKYQRLVERLAPLGLTVTRLTEDERGQVFVDLDGGLQLALGASDFRERMRRFVTVYRSELQARRTEIERIDLRYADGVAVAFTETAQDGVDDSTEENSQVAGL